MDSSFATMAWSLALNGALPALPARLCPAANTKTISVIPRAVTVNTRDTIPVLRSLFPVDMMLSILLLKLEPLPAPVTPAAFRQMKNAPLSNARARLTAHVFPEIFVGPARVASTI